MRKFTSLVMGLIAAVGLTVAGTGSASADVVVRDHRGPVVERDVVVRYPDRAPPPVTVVEHPIRRGYVWTDGGYDWINGRYVERPGRYVVERRGYHWAPERWEVRHGRYYHVRGRWGR